MRPGGREPGSQGSGVRERASRRLVQEPEGAVSLGVMDGVLRRRGTGRGEAATSPPPPGPQGPHFFEGNREPGEAGDAAALHFSPSLWGGGVASETGDRVGWAGLVRRLAEREAKAGARDLDRGGQV